MLRLLAVAIFAVTLTPVHAEAAKIRLGRSGSGSSSASPSSGAVVTPRLTSSSQRSTGASETAPARVPFPPASAPEPALRLSSADAPKTWCQGATVVGGFCVLN